MPIPKIEDREIPQHIRDAANNLSETIEQSINIADLNNVPLSLIIGILEHIKQDTIISYSTYTLHKSK